MKCLIILTTLAMLAIVMGQVHAETPLIPAGVSIEDLTVYNILSQLPRIGSQVWDFVYRPDEFSQAWLASIEYRINPIVSLAWCLSFMAIIYGIYHVIFKRPPFYIDYDKLDASRAFAVVHFGFIRFGWEHPEYNGPDHPTVAIYHLGFATIWFNEVKPSWLSSRTARMLMVAVAGLTFAISTLPISSIWENPVSFGELISFYSVVIIYATFSVVLLAFPLTFLPGYDGTESEKTDDKVANPMGCALLVFVPLLVMAPLRAVYLSVAGFYDFSVWQMMAMFFGGFLISGLVAPITFGIYLFIYYRFRKLIEAIF